MVNYCASSPTENGVRSNAGGRRFVALALTSKRSVARLHKVAKQFHGQEDSLWFFPCLHEPDGNRGGSCEQHVTGRESIFRQAESRAGRGESKAAATGAKLSSRAGWLGVFHVTRSRTRPPTLLGKVKATLDRRVASCQFDSYNRSRMRYSLLPSTIGCAGASFATSGTTPGCSFTVARTCSSLPKTSERFTGFRPATLPSAVPNPMLNS